MNASSGLLVDKTVLIIEDEVLIAVYVADLLAELGCPAVLHAHDIASATSELEKQSPDVALLDLRLGSVLSYPLAETLAALKIPFIFTTGVGAEGLKGQWASYPVLTKPYSSEALQATLEAVLAN